MMTHSRSLDPTDVKILALLYKDGRLSNKSLADAVGLAPSSCLERVKRLQKDNIIQGSGIQVNLAALGAHIQALIAVRLSNHSRDIVKSFQRDLLAQAEVISLFHIGGENDFQIHVAIADTLHLRDFVFNALTSRNEVTHVETTLVYDHLINRQLPQPEANNP